MKYLAIIPFLLLGQVAPDASPRTVWQRSLAWEHSGLDVNGQPETLEGFDLAISLPGENLNAGGAPIEIAHRTILQARDLEAVNGYLVPASVFDSSALAPGDYLAWVRAVDVSGNTSAWTSVALDGVPPKVVVRLRIVIEIETQ